MEGRNLSKGPKMQIITHGKIKCHHLQNHPKSNKGLLEVVVMVVLKMT